MATTFSSSPHPPRTPQPAHVEQVQLLDENASGDALPLSPAHSGMLNDGSDETLCRRCQQPTKYHSKNVPLCKSCYAALEKQATDWQEHDYLRRWLSTRCDERGNPHWGHTTQEQATIRRLCAKARRLNLDWTDVPPPMKFAERMKALLTPYAIDGDPESGADGGEAA